MSNTPNELSEIYFDRTEKLHDLKTSDPHFAKLMDDYHELNGKVHVAETDVEPTSDMHMEDLRKRRLHVLDQIAVYMNK